MNGKDIQQSARRARKAITDLELDAGELSMAYVLGTVDEAYRDNVFDALGRVRNELDLLQAWAEGTLGK